MLIKRIVVILKFILNSNLYKNLGLFYSLVRSRQLAGWAFSAIFYCTPLRKRIFAQSRTQVNCIYCVRDRGVNPFYEVRIKRLKPTARPTGARP